MGRVPIKSFESRQDLNANAVASRGVACCIEGANLHCMHARFGDDPPFIERRNRADRDQAIIHVELHPIHRDIVGDEWLNSHEFIRHRELAIRVRGNDLHRRRTVIDRHLNDRFADFVVPPYYRQPYAIETVEVTRVPCREVFIRRSAEILLTDLRPFVGVDALPIVDRPRTEV